MPNNIPRPANRLHDESAVGTPIRFLRLNEVLRRVGVSRSSLYRQISAGTFPKPVKLSEHSVGWLSTEIDAWIAFRLELRGSYDEA